MEILCSVICLNWRFIVWWLCIVNCIMKVCVWLMKICLKWWVLLKMNGLIFGILIMVSVFWCMWLRVSVVVGWFCWMVWLCVVCSLVILWLLWCLWWLMKLSCRLVGSWSLCLLMKVIRLRVIVIMCWCRIGCDLSGMFVCCGVWCSDVVGDWRVGYCMWWDLVFFYWRLYWLDGWVFRMLFWWFFWFLVCGVWFIWWLVVIVWDFFWCGFLWCFIVLGCVWWFVCSFVCCVCSWVLVGWVFWWIGVIGWMSVCVCWFVFWWFWFWCCFCVWFFCWWGVLEIVGL